MLAVGAYCRQSPWRPRYYDQMLGGMQNGTRYGRWADGEQIVGGSMGGPTVLFEASQARAMVLGSFQNFMSGSSVMVRKQAGAAIFVGSGANATHGEYSGRGEQ